MPAVPAIIMAGSAIASAAIAKKKSKQSKSLEAMQNSLLQKQIKRQDAVEPAQDAIMRSYAAMTSPGNFDQSSLKGLSGQQPPNYYGQGQGNDPNSKWWG